MAAHSSILPWRIPGTEEPGGYSPWGRKELDTTEHARAHSLCLTGVLTLYTAPLPAACANPVNP